MSKVQDSAGVMQWASVPISSIAVGAGRPLSEAHVLRLQESYERLGGQLLLQPILLSGDFSIIDGAHRLEAARRSGWYCIPALIFEQLAASRWPLIEIEANRVRKQPTPLELEAAWRVHYEPEFRAQAERRRLAALRAAGGSRANAAAPMDSAGLVLGNTKNQTRGGVPLSIAKAAKLTTGLSIETLNKISEVRSLAESATSSVELRALAASALHRLGRPGASVDASHRSLMQAVARTMPTPAGGADSQGALFEAKLDRVLEDSSLLAERLPGPLGEALEAAARSNGAAREQLRGVRVSLARSLATIVSIECRLENDPVRALRSIGSEVGRLLSNTSAQQLGITGR